MRPITEHRVLRSIASGPRLAHAVIVALLAIAALAAPLAVADEHTACISRVAAPSA